MIRSKLIMAAGILFVLAACSETATNDTAQGDMAPAPAPEETTAPEEAAAPEGTVAAHSDDHLATLHQQCMDARGHDGYCECGVGAIAEHLHPDHVSKTEDGNVTISDETPREASHTVQSAINDCEAEHLDEPEKELKPEEAS